MERSQMSSRPTASAGTRGSRVTSSATAKGTRPLASGRHPSISITPLQDSNATHGKTSVVLNSKPTSMGPLVRREGNATGSASTRRPSVQFSEDTLNSSRGATAQYKPIGSSSNSTGAGSVVKSHVVPRSSGTSYQKDDTAFRQNMSEFLTVMYGKDSATLSAKDTASSPINTLTHPAALSRTDRASMYKAAATTGTQRGPLVKGNTAPGVGQGPKHGDNIDTLVDHLMRAYSRTNSSARGGGSGGGMGLANEDMGVTYSTNGSRMQRHSSRNARKDPMEVTTFVSHAMDSFFGTARLQSNLNSKQSMLSELGLDTNFANLLSFDTKSNLTDMNGSDGPETMLEPLYIGQQAMFQSVSRRANDVSVSKSMGPMVRGRMAPMPVSHNANNDMSLNSAVLGNATRGGATATQRGPLPLVSTRGCCGGVGVNDRSLVSKMSLNSKALGLGRSGVDDSWAELDAEAKKNTAAERQDQLSGAGKMPVVSGTRSLIEYSKGKATLPREVMTGLAEEESLKRNMLAAVEQQLRGYIVATRSGKQPHGGGNGQTGGGTTVTRGRRTNHNDTAHTEKGRRTSSRGGSTSAAPSSRGSSADKAKK